MAILGGQVLDETLLSFLVEKSETRLSIDGQSLKDFRNRTEREYILNVLKTTEGNISDAAGILQIERTYLHKKIHDYKILKKEYFN